MAEPAAVLFGRGERRRHRDALYRVERVRRAEDVRHRRRLFRSGHARRAPRVRPRAEHR